MGEHIPKFNSDEEEAEFWSRTDLERLAPGQVEEIQVDRPPKPRSTTFAVRLDPRTVSLLRETARAYSTGVTQLVRRWILERLRLEHEVGVLAKPTTQYPTDFELALRRQVVETIMTHAGELAEKAMEDLRTRIDSEVRSLQDT